MNRKAYPGDVSDEEWAFVAPYLTLMTPADGGNNEKSPSQPPFPSFVWALVASV